MAGRRNTEAGVYVQGLSAMQRVLKRSEHELAPELKARLRHQVGGVIAPVARADAPVSGLSHRHMRDTIKVSVSLRGASIYSTAVYGGVQNYGGRVGRNRATVLPRAGVSQYMTRAVQSTRPRVEQQVLEVLDWLKHELEDRPA